MSFILKKASKRIRLLTSSSRPNTSSKRDWEAIKPALWAHYIGRVYHILSWWQHREGTYKVEYLQAIKMVLWVASYQYGWQGYIRWTFNKTNIDRECTYIWVTLQRDPSASSSSGFRLSRFSGFSHCEKCCCRISGERCRRSAHPVMQSIYIHHKYNVRYVQALTDT